MRGEGQLWLTRTQFSSLPLLFHAPTPLTGFHSTTKWLPVVHLDSIHSIRIVVFPFASYALRTHYKPFSPTSTRFKHFSIRVHPAFSPITFLCPHLGNDRSFSTRARYIILRGNECIAFLLSWIDAIPLVT